MYRLAVLISLPILLHPAAGPQPQAGPATHRRFTPPKPSHTDAEIERTLRAKLTKSKMAGKGFTVQVSAGTVTIEGKADVMQHKGAMTRMAKSSGGTRVINNIRISDEAKAKARERLATGRRRAQVKRGEVRSQPR